jgi:uncharacterized protein
LTARRLFRVGDFDRFRAAWWLPGGHLQTIWAALYARRTRQGPVQFQRERWTTPDGDFIDVDLQPAPQPDSGEGREVGAPWLVLFHGLEGSSASSYAQAFADVARERGWHYAVPHFRGCSGEINRAPRAYHSGDHEEIAWILGRLRERAGRPLLVVGVSLGGNALMRWAGEAETRAGQTTAAIAAVCSPLDLMAGGHSIDRGLNRHLYGRMFLKTMKAKAWAKLAQFPGLFQPGALDRIETLYEFDNLFTAPLHGFRDVDDYWRRASAKPHLPRIRVPALVLNARNDPFVPAHSLARPGEVGRWVTLWQPAHGGHVGFPSGGFPAHVLTMPDAVADWLAQHL